MSSSSSNGEVPMSTNARCCRTTLLAMNALALLMYFATVGRSTWSFQTITRPLEATVTTSLETAVSSAVNETSNDNDDDAFMQRLQQFNMSTVNCAAVLHDLRSQTTIKDPNGGKLYARYTDTSPPFWISVNNGQFDRLRFKIFDAGHYHETAVSAGFIEILQQSSKNTRVLDVGGNIGWYSLLAASLNAEVAVFEPNVLNYMRTCESMCLNGWFVSSGDDECLHGSTTSTFREERLHLFSYGVTNQVGPIYFKEHKTNPGQGQVLKQASATTSSIYGVTLDHMVQALGWTSGNVNILKVDVEGAELAVFRGATQLLKSKRVKHIFMEGNVRSQSEQSEFLQIVQILREGGFVLYKMGGPWGPDKTTVPSSQEANFTDNLVTACRKAMPAAQCNLWWKQP